MLKLTAQEATKHKHGSEKMENEILEALRVYGWQPTTVLSYAFGPDFGPAIKALHKEGKVEKHRTGWKAA